jgi:hypothetical protein
VPRARPVELLAQLPDEDVDGPVAMRLAPAPEPLEQLVARDDLPALERQGVEEAELGGGQVGALTRDVRLHLARVDAQLLDLDRLPARSLLRRHAAPDRDPDPRDQLLHRERLDEVVVGPDLERVHAVVLGPAGADDDDRRADPLGPGRLDQAPAVALRQHQVEDAHVRVLVPQACEPLLPAAGDHGVEALGRQMRGHPLCDHLVVLDDQHLRHRAELNREGATISPP